SCSPQPSFPASWRTWRNRRKDLGWPHHLAEPLRADGARLLCGERGGSRVLVFPAERLARVDDHLGVRGLAAAARLGRDARVEAGAPGAAHDIDLLRGLAS